MSVPIEILGTRASHKSVRLDQPAASTTRSRRIASPSTADACFFRSRAKPGYRKALLQVTERCDLRCAHCFVSATSTGNDMSLEQLRPGVVERLLAARVAIVTLTGGEPFVHDHVIAIAGILARAGMDVTICTNAVSITEADIEALASLRRVRVNVSLDGSSPASHGRFRGDPDSFHATMANTRALAAAGLLKGILSTPNAHARPDEYEELYALARELDAEYLLMNPLSSFGRGYWTRARLRSDDEAMETIQSSISAGRGEGDPEAVFIRFPNDSRPLTSCIAGEVFYVFVNGDTAICPYLVFAARNPGARHSPDEFIVGNLFRDDDFARRLDEDRFHQRYRPGSNTTCRSCDQRSECGCGCPAAVIARGGRLGELDAEVCPISGQSD